MPDAVVWQTGLNDRPSLVRRYCVNDLLSCDRNGGVDSGQRIGRGRVLNVAETVSRFPLVDRRDLRGAGVWYDVTMVQSQRVLVEILHWACSLGATALNYVEATRLVRGTSGISGVEARDYAKRAARTRSLHVVVCNCAGPWSPEVAERIRSTLTDLFRPSLAFNVLLDCTRPSASAVAIAPRGRTDDREPVYFLYPAFGGLLAGTVHAPWTLMRSQRPPAEEEQLEQFLADLNAAIPVCIFAWSRSSACLPACCLCNEDGQSTLTVRPAIWDHGRHGGPQGLFSVSGVKFTTARLVAEKTLAAMTGHFARCRRPSNEAGGHEDVGLDRFRPSRGAALARTKSPH